MRFLHLLIIMFAIMAVQTQKLRIAVIFLAVFSTLSSLLYLLNNAPDVAVAEIIVGSSISTILYLVALQKYNIFRILYLVDHEESEDVLNAIRKSELLDRMNVFCAKQELEPQLIFTTSNLAEAIQEDDYAIIIERRSERDVVVWGHPENYKFDALVEYVRKKHSSSYIFNFIRVQDQL